jgi:hypothetical protein
LSVLSTWFSMSTITTTLVTIVRRATATAADTGTPSPSPTSTGGDKSNQTPFLYFIALGLGIVFTNLWVILGLKYCFRNRRRRAMLAANGGVDVDSVNGQGDEFGFYMNPLLGPEFSRRRRRERRLMKTDELNERFPVMKYKVWGAEREKLGLPTEGGISKAAARSRPASIMEEDPELELEVEEDRTTLNEHQEVVVERPPSPPTNEPNTREQETEGEDNKKEQTEEHSKKKEEEIRFISKEIVEPLARQPSPGESVQVDIRAPPTPPPEEPEKQNNANVPITEIGESSHLESDSDDIIVQARPSTSRSEYDEEYRTTLVPPEIAEEPGDVCAVCLDSIEPEHDIRALGCNHVFHDECITPWLTTRRACCPLCKMDFSSARYRAEQQASAAVAEPESAHVREDGNATAAAAAATAAGTETQPEAVSNDNSSQPPPPRRNLFARVLFAPAPLTGVPRRNFIRIPYSSQ